MTIKSLLGVASIAIMTQTLVQAAPIVYSGAITVNDPAVTGNVGPFGIFDPTDTPPAQFWSFIGQAGEAIEIHGARSNANLDPALSLYRGLITPGTDYSAWDPFGSFDAVTFLAFADDEIDVPGPFGDPDLKIILQFTGAYTIAIGGAASDCPGGVCPTQGYPYSLRVTDQVPEPATLALLGFGLAGLGFSRRKQ